MTFEKLCELRSISKDKGLCLRPDEVDALLDEAWRLRIIIDVVGATLKLWHVLKAHGEKPDSILLRQQAAADEALAALDSDRDFDTDPLATEDPA
ncbi:MAG TPA: hypothetical protein VGH74_16365 [Planctomycetaceae bacterium]